MTFLNTCGSELRLLLLIKQSFVYQRFTRGEGAFRESKEAVKTRAALEMPRRGPAPAISIATSLRVNKYPLKRSQRVPAAALDLNADKAGVTVFFVRAVAALKLL